jgi:arabinoxylan arabinofuranohydrolase
MQLPRIVRILLSLLLSAGPVLAAPGGYLFVTFGGQANELNEQVYFATSRDGREWTTLNNGDPVLVSDIGTKGARDPYLLRSHDGKKFFIIATDLSMHHLRNWGRAVREGSRSILVWESTDLVNWSEPRLVKVAPDDAGCTWAPEAIYDEETGDYLVFWASTTGRDGFKKQRIWAARTKDFKTFGEPFIYIEEPNHVIDTTIVREGDAYYRFTKDETHKAVTMETAPRLSGPWTDVSGYNLGKLVGYEGPAIYQLEPARSGKPAIWGLILDYYSKGQGYQPWTTTDLARGEFQPAQGFKFPFKFRHGSVLPLTADELQRVERGFLSFSLVPEASEGRPINVETTPGTVLVPVQHNTNLGSFDPRFKPVPGHKLSPSGPQNFSNGPVTYKLTPDDRSPARTIRVSVEARNNPVIPGYNADPDIIYSEKNKRFYLYPTTDGVTDWNGSVFHTFSSENLVDWKDEGVILDLGPDVSWANRRAWAPCIIEKKTPAGYRYYYYFTAEQKIGVAVASDPAGPFEDSGRPVIAKRPPGAPGGQEIDPAGFQDPKTGKCYLYWGNNYLAVAELADDMLSIKEDTIQIMTPDKTFREGATVFFRNGRYYFLWSEDDTRSENYRVRYATAATPLGPLEIPKDNLVIAKDPAAGIYATGIYATGIYATGHNSVIQIPGRDEWYIVYHRFNYAKGITMGREAGYHREVCIDRMEFAPDGSIRRITPTHAGIQPARVTR